MDPDVVLDSIFDDTGMFPSQETSSVAVEEATFAGEGNAEPIELEADEAPHSSTHGPSSGVNVVETDCDEGDGWVPVPGFVVQHLMEGFVRYSNYAKRIGFEIRFRSSEKSKKADGVDAVERRKRMKRGIRSNWFYADYETCCRVRIQCVKGEVPRPNRRDPKRPVRSQACKCMVGVSLVNLGDGCWMFKTVRLEHNHSCDPSMTRFMKNYRMVTAGDEMQIVVSDRAGVPPARIFTSFAVGYGGVQNVPFRADDCRSIVRESRMRGLENGDFNAMQKLFNELIVALEDFFYLYDTDDEGRVKNVFWADGRSRAAYKDFGDVVCFDTTYLKNRYKMPLAPFIGVNHHGQSILLGVALISNETTESFTWVFQAWMRCMSQKHPKCIMTDQCQAIGNGIALVFPQSTHRWCLWHVMKNAEHLKWRNDWVEMRKELKEAVHDSCNAEGFEGMWNQLVIKYGLEDNEWIFRMYACRSRWVPIYFRHEFWAGLQSTQRSEGMNNFFRSYVNINTTLKEFAEQYCLFVGKRVDDKERQNFRSFNKPILCDTRFPCERVLQEIYTSNKFLEVQIEAKGVGYTTVELVHADYRTREYMVTDRGVEKVFGAVVTRTFSVKYKSVTHVTLCECCRFSFRGIICRHMIAVWQLVDLELVPHRYIMDRWRKDKFREYSIIKIPHYSLAFDKTCEYKKAEEMQHFMRYIGSLAMGCDDLYSVLMPGLEILKAKCDEFIGSYVDIKVDSVGRFYKKRVNDEDGDSLPDLTVKFVLDPPNQRGRGRVPTRRKGYRKEKKRKPAAAVLEGQQTQVLFA